MTVKYFAFDGTEFDTEDECYDYERRIKYEELLPDYKTKLYERVIIDNHKGLKRAFNKR